MINLLPWIIAGAGIGCLARMVMSAEGRTGLLLNVFVGILGALSAGAMLNPLLGFGTFNEGGFSLPALLVASTGSMLLLPIFNLLVYSQSRYGRH